MHYTVPGTTIKAISLNEFPPEAWDILSGGQSDNDDAVKYARAVGVLYRCIDIRADAIQKIPWVLRRGETILYDSTDTDDSIPDMEWLVDLGDVLSLVESSMCILSEAFLFVERNRVRVTGLKWLAPSTMTALWDEANGLVGFNRTLNGKTRAYPPEDILYVWRPDPMHETAPATSPVEAAMASAGVLYNLDQFAAKFFERGAIKSTLLTVEGAITDDERSRLKAWWKRLFSGVDNAWQTEVVRSKLVPIPLGEGVAEINNTELLTEKRGDVATAMGVPHSILFANAANYATAQQDEANFYNATVIPSARRIGRALNKQLFNPLGYSFEWQPWRMDIFQEDEVQRAQAFASYVGAGLKPSIVAEMLGLELPEGVDFADLDPEPEPEPPPVIMQSLPPEPEDDEDEDEDEEPMGRSLRSLAATEWQAERRAFARWARKRRNPDPSKFIARYLTERDKAAILAGMEGGADQPFFQPTGTATPDGKATRKPDDDGYDRERADLEEQHADRIGQALRKLLRQVAPPGTTPENITPDLAWERYQQNSGLLRDAIVAMLKDAGLFGVEVGRLQVERIMGLRKADDAGMSINWDMPNEDVLAWILSQGDIGIGTGYADSIMAALAQTSEKQIRRHLAEWVQNGLPLQDLIDGLERTVFSRERATRIAVTEVTRAFAQGNTAAWQRSNVIQGRRWITNADEYVCPICRQLNGTVADLYGGWELAPKGPPAHVGCRCWVGPVAREIAPLTAEEEVFAQSIGMGAQQWQR